jgi:hypothetical protein
MLCKPPISVDGDFFRAYFTSVFIFSLGLIYDYINVVYRVDHCKRNKYIGYIGIFIWTLFAMFAFFGLSDYIVVTKNLDEVYFSQAPGMLVTFSLSISSFVNKMFFLLVLGLGLEVFVKSSSEKGNSESKSVEMKEA